MDIIADARLRKKPLHVIYTDIKGAFPSVPYQAFTDALTMLGLDGKLSSGFTEIPVTEHRHKIRLAVIP
jgi:hypothetical protein